MTVYDIGNSKTIDCNKYHNYIKISNLKILAYNKTDKYLNVTYSFSNLIIFTCFFTNIE